MDPGEEKALALYGKEEEDWSILSAFPGIFYASNLRSIILSLIKCSSPKHLRVQNFLDGFVLLRIPSVLTH